jgi:uncharacterized protein
MSNIGENNTSSRSIHSQLISAILAGSCHSKHDSLDEAIMIIDKYNDIFDVNRFSQSGNTALGCAVFYHQHNIIKALLTIGANPDIGDIQFSVPPLITAIGLGDKSLQTCKILIENGANINYRDWFGQSPLWVASACENIDILKLLLDNHAHINAIDYTKVTPLMKAAEHGYYNHIEMLLQYGACVDIEDDQGFRALDYATKGNYEDIVKLLTRSA